MNRGSPITDEKRTLIDTDASQHRFTLMIFQIFHLCESVFPPSCLRAVVSSWFFTSLRYHWFLYFRNSITGSSNMKFDKRREIGFNRNMGSDEVRL